jgi:branched-chain amino acid transport system permease protein
VGSLPGKASNQLSNKKGWKELIKINNGLKTDQARNAFQGIGDKLGISPSGFALIVILGLLSFVIKDEFQIRLLVSTMMFAAMAMAFDLTNGYVNICNFGFCAFWGLGAYTSAILAAKLGISPWIGMLCGAAMAAVLGFCLGLLTIRLGGIFASCMTWFVALAMMAIASNWVDLTGGSAGLNVPNLFQTAENRPYFYVMYGIMVLVLFVSMYITKSNMGLAFKAVGQDIEAASSSGISPNKYKIANLTISCALAGLVGGFYAHYIGTLTPQVMHTSRTVEVMAISFIGGRGTIWGSLVSALIMVPLMEYAKGLMEFRLIIYGAAMILCMIFYPRGIVGILEIVKRLLNNRRKNTKEKVESAV